MKPTPPLLFPDFTPAASLPPIGYQDADGCWHGSPDPAWPHDILRNHRAYELRRRRVRKEQNRRARARMEAACAH